MRVNEEELSPFSGHEPPARRRRLCSNTEEAEARLDQDRTRHDDRGDDQYGAHHVWDHVAHQRDQVPVAEPSRRAHVVEFALFENAGAHDAAGEGAVDDGQRDDRGLCARSHDGDQHQRQQQTGEGQDAVDDPADDRVQPSAVEAGERAHEAAEQHARDRYD